MNAELIFSILALIVSSFTFANSLFTRLKDHSRRKKQATIEYFEKMTLAIYDKESRFSDILATKSIKEISKSTLQANPSLLKDAVEILSSFERLSVGINTGVFDFDILHRMAGSYLEYIYGRFKKYIDETRENKKHVSSYIEFEAVVNRISQLRKNKEAQFAMHKKGNV